MLSRKLHRTQLLSSSVYYVATILNVQNVVCGYIFVGAITEIIL